MVKIGVFPGTLWLVGRVPVRHPLALSSPFVRRDMRPAPPELVRLMKANFPDPHLPTLLIVDDCEDDIFLLRHHLREGEITNPIVTFNRTGDALAYLRSSTMLGNKPAFVFTDIKMPDGCGLEFIGRIRENPEWDDVRVVVVTSSNQPRDLQAALARRVDGYLIKFPVAEILAEFVRHGPWFAVPRRATSAMANALSA